MQAEWGVNAGRIKETQLVERKCRQNGRNARSIEEIQAEKWERRKDRGKTDSIREMPQIWREYRQNRRNAGSIEEIQT